MSGKSEKKVSGNDNAALMGAGRLLAIDWGKKYIGLAVSDETRFGVRPLPHIKRTSWKNTIKLIASVCQDLRVHALVLGLPLQPNGAEGTAAQEIREISRKLTLTLDLQVFLQDERLTSLAAEEFLRARGGHLLTPEHVHSRAAAIILQDYLSRIEQHLTASHES